MREKAVMAKGSAWIFSGQILTKLISFIYTIIIARILIEEEIGLFYLALSVLGILYLFTDLGLIYALNRYVPYLYGRKEFGKLRSLVGLSYIGGGTLTLIFAAAVFLLEGTISDAAYQPAIKPIIEMLALWLFVKEIDDINQGILAGRKKVKELQILVLGQNFLKLALTVVAFYSIGLSAEALSAGYLISFILVLPIGGYLVINDIKTWKKDETQYTLSQNITFGKEIVYFGLVITLATALTTLMQSIDKIMIGYLLPEALTQVAIYSIATGLASLVLIIPSSINGIFFPIVSELHGSNETEEIRKTTATSIKWTIMLMTPVVIIMSVFSERLLSLFYGASYVHGDFVLLIFAFSIFIRSIFQLPSLVIAAVRRLDVELKTVFVATITNILLNLILIPQMGINGAALATLASTIVMCLMLWHYARGIFGFRFPTEAYKPIVAGALTLAVVLVIKPYLTIASDLIVDNIQLTGEGQIVGEAIQKTVKLGVFGMLMAVSTAGYFIALYLAGSFGKDETDLMQAALRRAGVPAMYVELAGKLRREKDNYGQR